MTGTTEIFIAGASDRQEGVRRALGEFDLSGLSGAAVALKANFNSADPFPASTDIGTLGTICNAILAEHPGQLALAERSGMGRTSEVLTRMGVDCASHEKRFFPYRPGRPRPPRLAGGPGARAPLEPRLLPRLGLCEGRPGSSDLLPEDPPVRGAFHPLPQKLRGLRRPTGPGRELRFHGRTAQFPAPALDDRRDQRFYRTDLVVMDATEGFASGGPDKGKLIRPGLIIAGGDRVAVDAVGVALLRIHNTVPDVADGQIFGLEQIARAAELGVGVASADAIRLVPLDGAGETAAQEIQEQLDADRQEYDQCT